MGDLAGESGDETRLVGRGGAHVRVEVAVGALSQTERPVHIDREPGIAERARIRHHGDAFESAHARVMPAQGTGRHRPAVI